MLLVGAVLAVASAARFYCVNWLGERVGRRHRRDVVQASHRSQPRLLRSRAYRRGDVAAHRRHDADQGGGEPADLDQALRNSLMLVGAVAMMVVTSLRLSLPRAPRHSAHRAAAGRYTGARSGALSREAQDALAQARRPLRARAWPTSRGSRPSLPGATRFRQQFAEAVERSFVAAARPHVARAAPDRRSPSSSSSRAVVGMLWYGAQDVLPAA